MRNFTVAVPLAALLTLGACSSPDESSTSTGSASGSQTAGVAPAAASIPVIAEQKDLPVSHQEPGDKVTVGLRSLKVDPNGRTMTLRLVFTPHFASKGPAETVTLSDLNGAFYVLPTLLDRVNLKRYSVLSGGSSGGWYESGSFTGAPNGHPFEAWFGFAAPRDPVSTLEVSVLDEWRPFTDVPVQR
jgi:hypothetical protein